MGNGIARMGPHIFSEQGPTSTKSGPDEPYAAGLFSCIFTAEGLKDLRRHYTYM